MLENKKKEKENFWREVAVSVTIGGSVALATLAIGFLSMEYELYRRIFGRPL